MPPTYLDRNPILEASARISDNAGVITAKMTRPRWNREIDGAIFTADPCELPERGAPIEVSYADGKFVGEILDVRTLDTGEVGVWAKVDRQRTTLRIPFDVDVASLNAWIDSQKAKKAEG